MRCLESLKEEVLAGHQVSREEALWLYDAPLEELCLAADEIRAHFCGHAFDLCTIINGKSGKCTEDCKYCAQSSFYPTRIQEYPLLGTEKIVNQAKVHAAQGVLRYSIVTSGRNLEDEEIDRMCQAVQAIRQEVDISVCVSFGLLTEKQYGKLKEAGVTRVHNNVETSRQNFPRICTTHSFAQKVAAIRAAQEAGLEVCSGGIVGLGETPGDRIDMALTLRDLGIRSVPVNLLNPIPGTPYEHVPALQNEDMRRIVAVFRFLLPQAAIRLAGGRGLLPDKGKACFVSGANAAISGDMLTTAGISVQRDRELLHTLHYQVRPWE